MTSDLQAFAELIRAERQENPFILARVWHIRTENGHGTLCGTWAQCWCTDDHEGVTKSEIDICRNCQRISNAHAGTPPEAIIPRAENDSHQQTP